MIGVCSACTGSFEGSEEETSAPGFRCPGCYFLNRAYGHVAAAIADIGSAARADPQPKFPSPSGVWADLDPAYILLGQVAEVLKRHAKP